MIRLLLAAIATSLLTFALRHSWSLGSSQLPPLGEFLSPHHGYWQNAETTDAPQVPANLKGVTQPVQVYFDDKMVPHIYGENTKDVLFAQGYLQAMFRLWQMDMTVRASQGRLAEVLGPNLLPRDKMQRRRGLVMAAQNAVKSWEDKPEQQELLNAFTAGVNAYVQQLKPAQYPLEYKLMQFAPEPWSALHTAAWFTSMCEVLNSGEDDLEASNTLKFLGQADFDLLFPLYNPKQKPIVESSPDWNLMARKTPSPAQPSIGWIGPRPFSKPDEHVGSNNWAISAQKSANGHPILCNDPHLSLTLPSIWFEVHLETPEWKAYGVTFPGVPGVVLGFNEHIAWGSTNVGWDVADWYKVAWTDESKTSYWLDSVPTAVRWQTESFKVKGGLTTKDSVKYTVWGPIVQDTGDYADLAYQWITHDVSDGDMLGTFWGLNRAINYQDYQSSLTMFKAPAQNLVFADRSGDIAIQVTGKFPVRHTQEGRFIESGQSQAQVWRDFIPFDLQPKVKNPLQGFVFSANQHSTPPSYPYFYTGGFEDYRGRSLYQGLDTLTKANVANMQALQLSKYSQFAADLTPVLLKYVKPSEDTLGQKIITTLRAWDYTFDEDTYAPVFFQEWVKALKTICWEEFYKMNKKHPVLIPEDWRLIELLDSAPHYKFFDLDTTATLESGGDLVNIAFGEILKKLSKGPLQDWGQYSGFHIRHMANIPALGRKDLRPGGHPTALNAINGPSSFGPSWRMVVIPGQEAWGVYPGGQSGHPGSPHYDDQVKHWVDGEYYRLHFERANYWTNENTSYKLTFQP